MSNNVLVVLPSFSQLAGLCDHVPFILLKPRVPEVDDGSSCCASGYLTPAPP